jgi:N-acetylmuramoyl-L-alanine amidase CwlA
MPFRTIQIDIDDAVFQAALNRASSERKAIGQIVVDFLKQYAAQSTPVTAKPVTTSAPLTSSTPTAPSSTAAPAPAVTYTVQRGDTLARIALKQYGDARKYPVIQKANNLADAGRIYVGQVLTIPSISTPSTATPVVPTISPITTPKKEVSPKPTRTGAAPPKPSIQWVGSPNFNRRRQPDDITAIVIHSTANSNLQRVVEWFNNPNAQVSAHYTIGKDGKIVQHVKDSDRAWHAGQSVWKGRNSVNDYGLGIELVNLNDGRDPYPEAQHRANVALCAYLCHQYNIEVDDIMGHVDIALPPGRKSDPRAYDLNRLRREVAAILGD